MICWKNSIWIITFAASILAHGATVHSSRSRCKFFLQQTNYTIHCDECCVICWKMVINPKNHISRENSSSQRVFLQQMNCTLYSVQSRCSDGVHFFPHIFLFHFVASSLLLWFEYLDIMNCDPAKSVYLWKEEGPLSLSLPVSVIWGQKKTWQTKNSYQNYTYQI